jgi:hypothetical protein
MTRSRINKLLREAIGFMAEHRFHLPPFAFWTPEDWRRLGDKSQRIIDEQLGWDITDFGSGDFASTGLLLFTLRNGRPANPQSKSYAEKIMIVRQGQLTPTHFHWHKTEDIINRGGGRLVVQLWNATPDDGLAETPVRVVCDGLERAVEAGGSVSLEPGESVTLPPRLYHQFWGERGAGDVLVGEVSKVNDDHTDNRFHQPVGRFPAIDEDQPPLHLLVSDYPPSAGADKPTLQ